MTPRVAREGQASHAADWPFSEGRLWARLGLGHPLLFWIGFSDGLLFMSSRNRQLGGSHASRRHKAALRVRVSQRYVKVVHTILYLKLRL